MYMDMEALAIYARNGVEVAILYDEQEVVIASLQELEEKEDWFGEVRVLTHKVTSLQEGKKMAERYGELFSLVTSEFILMENRKHERA